MPLLIQALLLAAGLLLLRCDRGPQPGVAAVVNGYKITDEELERHYQNHVGEMEDSPSETQERMMRLTLLRELIDRHIMLHRAERLGLLAVDAEVEAGLREYRSPYRSDQEFQQHLEDRGMTAEELRAELRRTLTLEKLINEEIVSNITVSDAEIRGFYEENKESFHLPEQQFHLAQIVVTAVPEVPVPNHRNDDAKDLKSAKEKIQMLEQRLEDGEDFGTLAQEYSEDVTSTPNSGDLGFIPQSALGDAELTLRRVVASLSPGEISPIIQTGDQFRIIKLNSIEPAGQQQLDDPRVQQTIRETLMNRKDQLLRAAYLETRRSEADVRNYLAQRIVENFSGGD